jgi:hypothetical protein
VLAWVLGAACAVAVGALALSLIGSSLGDRSRPPLATQADTQDDGQASDPPAAAPPSSPASSAKESPAGSPSASPSPRRSASPAPHLSPSPAPVPIQRDFTFDVGSVTAQCTGDMAYLVSWSPAQGYRVDGVRRGPALTVHVELESLTTEAGITVRCVDGIPRASVSHEPRR